MKEVYVIKCNLGYRSFEEKNVQYRGYDSEWVNSVHQAQQYQSYNDAKDSLSLFIEEYHMYSIEKYFVI